MLYFNEYGYIILKVVLKMKQWINIKENIKSLNKNEKENIEIIVDIISAIIKRRQELNITQRELEKITGIKQPAIARIESLEVIPRIDTLLKILNPLGLKIKIISKEK